MSYCRNCGSQLQETDNFCETCGTAKRGAVHKSTTTGKTCPFCQFPLKADSEVTICSACGIPHHRECWAENGGCAIFGCKGKRGNKDFNNRSERQAESRIRSRSFVSLNRSKSFLIDIIAFILLFLLASLSFFLIHNRVSEGPPALAGFTFYVMQDDRLNSDVNPGSLAVVRRTDVTAVMLGDIISFRDPASPTVTVTQRVVEINRDDGLQFVTSGDGAGAAQTTAVPAENVLGKVLFLVPIFGSMVDYVQTGSGTFFFIILPGLIIVFIQLRKIIRYYSVRR